jgi:hypothetical protein
MNGEEKNLLHKTHPPNAPKQSYLFLFWEKTSNFNSAEGGLLVLVCLERFLQSQFCIAPKSICIQGWLDGYVVEKWGGGKSGRKLKWELGAALLFFVVSCMQAPYISEAR